MNNINYFTIKEKLIEKVISKEYVDDEMIEYPNDFSTTCASEIIKIFKSKKFYPATFTPSLDGGFITEFFIENNYNIIEIFNENTIVFIENNLPAQEYTFQEISDKLNILLN